MHSSLSGAPACLRPRSCAGVGRRWAAASCGLLTAACLAGCQRAPAYSILGSFFPVWLFCGAGGILLAFLVHLLLVHLRRNRQLQPPLLVYPALATVFTLTFWLIFFR